MTEKEDILSSESIIDQHSDYLFNVAFSKLKNRDLSLDFVQETLLTFLEKKDQFEGRSSLRTYLTTILNRKIIDHWRKQKSSTSSSNEDGALNVSAQSNFDSDFNLLKEEQRLLLMGCLEKLPEKAQEILLAKYFEDKQSEEICKELDLTKSNFWVLVHRAKISLRDCLGNAI